MNGRLRRALLIVLLTITGLAAYCSPPLTPAEQVIVDKYLICIECPEPLQNLLALAALRPEAVDDSLNIALRRGLDSMRSLTTLSLLSEGYARDSAWRAGLSRPMLPPRDSVVAREFRRYDEGYRMRGAIGLGWIHDERAVRHLRAALGDTALAPAVRRAVQFALDSLPVP